MLLRYDTDRVMKKIWLCLARDFRRVYEATHWTRYAELLAKSSMAEFRDMPWPARGKLPAYYVKAEYQLEALFKRYRFREDKYTDAELLEMSSNKFIETQQRIGVPLSLPPSSLRVLRVARLLIKNVLEEYDENEHMSLVRFGNRACVGHPYQRSYLDLKLGGPITGSQDHIAWFSKYLETDPLMVDLVDEGSSLESKLTQCDTLALSFVPKSFKALRPVKPQTLLGSLYTNGLGDMITKRLRRNAGLDIRHLQQRHRRLVKLASLKQHLVTADLSAASDSLSRELLRRLLPCRWYHAIVHGCARSVEVNGRVVQLNSVATMGDGHTFPLQTLVFWALLKALGVCINKPNAFVSVYGDDLIYPVYLHKYVKRLFPSLHLILNEDKTYVTGEFKESCGSDCYRGVDVRPFSPEGGHQLLGRQPYACFLYKLCNGLQNRWSEPQVEIPETWEFLMSELILTQKEIYQVPPSFPDSSGLKVAQPSRDYFFAPVTYARTTHTWVFKYLRLCSDKRVVKSQFPYYWERLRQSERKQEPHVWLDEKDVPTLVWVKTQNKAGMSIRRAAVLDKVKSRLVGQTGSTSCWI